MEPSSESLTSDSGTLSEKRLPRMRHRSSSRLRCVLLGLLLLTAGLPIRAAERGFPLIQTYDPGLAEADIQSFDVATDSRGLVYVGNGGGLLTYDGAWWRNLPIGKAKAVFSLASGADGRIGVGGVDELGYLAPDAAGSLQYVSLVGQLPPGDRQFGQVMKLHSFGPGFAYLTDKWLRVWDGSRLTTVARFPGDRPFAVSFDVGETVYVWAREGLFRLAGTGLQPVAGGEVFRGRRVDMILPATSSIGSTGSDTGTLLVSVRGEGLFLFKNGQAVPFAPAASRWTAEKRLFTGLRLPDGRWALGSILGGVLLLRPDGEMDQVIDTGVGLSDDFVSGMALDREGSLWLALNNGLARVEVSSPLSVIDRRSGLQGERLRRGPPPRPALGGDVGGTVRRGGWRRSRHAGNPSVGLEPVVRGGRPARGRRVRSLRGPGRKSPRSPRHGG